MKLFLFSLILPTTFILAQKISPSLTDLEFAEHSYKVGVAQAFYDYFTEDGILITPTPFPIKGRGTIKDYFSKVKSKALWQPSGEYVSSDGNFAFTYGFSRWVYFAGDSLGSYFSTYCTNWKNVNGVWKVVSDIGTESQLRVFNNTSFKDLIKTKSPTFSQKNINSKNSNGFVEYLSQNADSVTISFSIAKPNNKASKGIAIYVVRNHLQENYSNPEFAALLNSGVSVLLIYDNSHFEQLYSQTLQVLLDKLSLVPYFLSKLKMDSLPIIYVTEEFATIAAAIAMVSQKNSVGIVFTNGVYNPGELLQYGMSEYISSLRNSGAINNAYIEDLGRFDAISLLSKTNPYALLAQYSVDSKIITKFDMLNCFETFNGKKTFKAYDTISSPTMSSDRIQFIKDVFIR